MNWMAWTWPTGIFFASIAVLLGVMALWEVHSPSSQRQGLLPFPTTRGDRLFVGLLGMAFVNLGWVALVTASPWFGFGLGLVWMAAVARWG